MINKSRSLLIYTNMNDIIFKSKSRTGSKITIYDDKIVVADKSFGREKIRSMSRDQIDSISTLRSTYDLPFLEKTVIIQTESGKKFKIKRLPFKDAVKIQSILS